MHPLEALGLERDADERAVKRAYAQRLKTTRPDEDPAGFQALHEIYRRALAFVAGHGSRPPLREAVARDPSPPDAGMPAGPAVPAGPLDTPNADASIEAPPPGAPPFEEQDRGPPPVADAVWNRGFPVVAQEPEPYDLPPPVADVDLFVEDLTARLALGAKAGDFTSWLEERLYDWPITSRLEAAPHVLTELRDSEVDVTPAQLHALTEAFNFDDVQSRCDPMALKALRRRADGELLSPHFASVARRAANSWPTWLWWAVLGSLVLKLLLLLVRP